MRFGDRVVVLGQGASGLLVTQCARLAGARQLITVEPLAFKRELSTRLGADVALDPADGSEVWSRDVRSGNFCANSAVVDRTGVIYIVSNDWLHAFEPDGSPHWPQPFELTLLQEKSTSSPAIGADGTIYFGAEKSGGGFAGYVYAVNADGTGATDVTADIQAAIAATE